MSHLRIPIIKRMDSPSSNNENESDTFNQHFDPSRNQKNTLSPNYGARQMMPRPSVRSISETPNVIGAQAIENQNDICTILLCALSWLLVIIFFPFSLAFIFRVVQEFERAVIFRLGRLKNSSCGPGVILVNFLTHPLPSTNMLSKICYSNRFFPVLKQQLK